MGASHADHGLRTTRFWRTAVLLLFPVSRLSQSDRGCNSWHCLFYRQFPGGLELSLYRGTCSRRSPSRTCGAKCGSSRRSSTAGRRNSSNAAFEVFTRVSPNNSLERLTERSVGIVTDRPSDVYELLVTLL